MSVVASDELVVRTKLVAGRTPGAYAVELQYTCASLLARPSDVRLTLNLPHCAPLTLFFRKVCRLLIGTHTTDDSAETLAAGRDDRGRQDGGLGDGRSGVVPDAGSVAGRSELGQVRTAACDGSAGTESRVR